MILRLNEDKSKIILEESSREEFNQLKRFLSPFTKNYRFQQRYKLHLWDGKIDMFNNGIMAFGLWNAIQRCCKEYGYKFIIKNKDEFPVDLKIKEEDIIKFCKEFYVDHKTQDQLHSFMPHEHQIKALFKLMKYKFGNVEIATSGGKSLVIGTMIFYILKYIKSNAKFLIIVNRADLVTQFYNDINDYNLGFHGENKNPLPNIRIDEIMSDKPRKYHGEEPNIYIGTYQSLEKWPADFFTQFHLVANDEAHGLSASNQATNVKIVSKLMRHTMGYANYRFGVTGTYPNEDSAEMLSIEAVTGPILYRIGTGELQEKGIIADFKIKALLLNYDDREFAESIFMIKKRGGGKTAYELEKKYAQNSEKRKLFVCKLVTKFKQNSVILFFNKEYGRALYDFLRDNVPDKNIYYIDGDVKKDKRVYIKEQMEKTDGNVNILVASFGTMSTGVSIRALTNLILADSFKSDQIVRQSIGRVLRLHQEKEKAMVFDLVDVFHSAYKTTTLYSHYQVRKKEIYVKQNFPLDEIKIAL